MFTLYPYQQEAHDAVFAEFAKGVKSTLLVACTGSGKTIMASAIAKTAIQEGKPVLFLAHRDVLIWQAVASFEEAGLEVAIEKGQDKALDYFKSAGRPDIVVASVQSLHARRLPRWSGDAFGLIICDEAHRGIAVCHRRVFEHFKSAKLLGLTATPARGDGKNLGTIFETKAFEYGMRRAISEGALVPIKLRRCHVPVDLRGIRTTGGDFNQGDLEERIGPKVEVLARAFADEIGERKAVAFTPDCGSALAFADVLNSLGVTARYVAGSSGRYGITGKEKEQRLEEFKQNQFQVITCCELLTEGWDDRPVSAVGIVRPTKQWYRVVQMIGRGTRRSPETGKDSCVVIDFDWKTDASTRNLAASIEIFDDGSLDQEVIKIAKRLVEQQQKEGVEVDTAEVLKEAQEAWQRQKQFRINLTKAKVRYKVVELDATGISEAVGIKLKYHDYDYSNAPPASEKQLNYLRSLGVKYPEKLSKWGASKMIDRLLRRKKEGMASPDQIRELTRQGYTIEEARDFTQTAATESLEFLGSRKQKEMFG